MTNQFDYAMSVKHPAGLMTQATLESILDNPSVAEICDKVADIIAHILPETPKKEMREYKEKANALKKQLPIMIPHAHFTDHWRHVESAVESPWCSMDFDGLDDPRDTWSAILPQAEALGIVFAFVSPSGRGLKIIFRKPLNMNREAAQKWFADKVWMPDYDHTHDLARSCYLVPRKNVVWYKPELLFGTIEPTTESSENLTTENTETSTETEAESAETNTSVDDDAATGSAADELNYKGVPYATIIKKYWELFNFGQEPNEGDRNTKIFELACNLRHICGFNADLLCKVIPNYDGFPENEKRVTIENAVKEKRGRMPMKMAMLLNQIRAANTDSPEIVNAIDEAEEEDENFYINQIDVDKLPMGLRDCLDGLNKGLALPALVAIGPMIGTLATKIRFDIHGKKRGLNLFSLIVGDAASNKSEMDELDHLWMNVLREQDEVNLKVEDEYRNLPPKKKEQTKEPHVMIRCQALRTSVADVLYRLKHGEGLHIYSYAPEADQLASSNKSSWNDTSVLIRQAYDGSSYSSSYRSDKATNCYIKEVLWNITMCCTPDALFRVIPNYTDGEVTRVALARTPDNTYTSLGNTIQRSQQAADNIMRISRVLCHMQGDIVLPKLEQRCCEWLEKVRIRTMKNDDRTQARLRFRSGPTAMRFTAGYILCAYAEWLIKKIDHPGRGGKRAAWTDGCQTAEEFLDKHPELIPEQILQFQTPEMLDLFEILAEYFLDNTLYYFREKIENAQKRAMEGMQLINNRRLSSNDSLFGKLALEFSYEDAKFVKGTNATSNEVKQMIKNWKKSGLIEVIGYCKYRKVLS